MKKRFSNIRNKINSLLTSNKYYVSISPSKKNFLYEKNYHQIAVDPDGKKRFLLNERRNFLNNNKHLISILKKSKPGRILDLGCGLGWFLSTLDSKWEKYGVDISKFAINNASKYCIAEVNNIELFLKNKKNKKKKFDYIICSHVIEHVKNPIFVLKNIKNFLKKNGKLFLETPDFDSAAFRLFGDKFRLLNDPTHISLFTLESMTRALRDNGYIIKKIDFPFFNTNYFNKQNLLKILNYKKQKISPPFYGSVMFYICQKK